MGKLQGLLRQPWIQKESLNVASVAMIQAHGTMIVGHEAWKEAFCPILVSASVRKQILHGTGGDACGIFIMSGVPQGLGKVNAPGS